MSRIGRKAVEIAKGASVEVKGTDIVVKGPKGELHAQLMPGISVDKHAIVGAGAVVTKDVPDCAVAVGNPAKVIKMLDPNKFA